MMPERDATIVGAGLSGLTAAIILARDGFAGPRQRKAPRRKTGVPARRRREPVRFRRAQGLYRHRHLSGLQAVDMLVFQVFGKRVEIPLPTRRDKEKYQRFVAADWLELPGWRDLIGCAAPQSRNN